MISSTFSVPFQSHSVKSQWFRDAGVKTLDSVKKIGNAVSQFFSKIAFQIYAGSSLVKQQIQQNFRLVKDWTKAHPAVGVAALVGAVILAIATVGIASCIKRHKKERILLEDQPPIYARTLDVDPLPVTS